MQLNHQHKKGSAMTDKERNVNATTSTRKAADKIAKKVLDKEAGGGSGSVDYHCTGIEFKCNNYNCSAPDKCDHKFDCTNTYKEPDQ
jgi:hypothetical protein